MQAPVVPRTTAWDGSNGAAVLIVSGDLLGGSRSRAPLTRDELVGALEMAPSRPAERYSGTASAAVYPAATGPVTVATCRLCPSANTLSESSVNAGEVA